MNKIRRKSLRNLVEQFEVLQNTLDELREEEQDCLDNIPDNLQGSDRYQNLESSVGYLEDALSSLEDVISAIQCSYEEV